MTTELNPQAITNGTLNPTLNPPATPQSRLLCLSPGSRPNLLPAINKGTTLSTQPFTEPTHVVQGLLHKGTKGVVAGSSKVGKTWLLLDLAMSVAAGLPFLKWQSTPARVLYINLEIQEAFMNQRLRQLMEKKGLNTIDNLDIWNLRGKVTDFDRLLTQVPTNEYSLIILDPIYKLMVGKCENNGTGVGFLCHNLERLAEKTGAAIVYAHHFSKGNQAKKKAMDRISGSGVYARDADTILTVTEHHEPGCYAVELSLRNLPPQEAFVVEWSFPVMKVREDLDAGELKTDNVEEEEVTILDLLEVPLTTKEWEVAAKEEGISRSPFYRQRKELKAAGLVTLNPDDEKWYQSQSQFHKNGTGTGKLETGAAVGSVSGEVETIPADHENGDPVLPPIPIDTGETTARQSYRAL
jgi:hypothetical protein